jgi:hypothetical protein
VIEVLRDVVTHSPAAALTGVHAIRAVNAIEAQRISEAAAEASRQRRDAAAREVLLHAAEEVFDGIGDRLRAIVKHNAPEARMMADGLVGAGHPCLHLTVRLGEADLRFQFQGSTPSNATFPVSKWNAVALGFIRVTQNRPVPWQHGATLWYMRRAPEEGLRWHEVAYKRHAFVRGPLLGAFPIQDLDDEIYQQADLAAGPGMHSIAVESGPTPIDDEDVEAFVERWVARLASAYNGRLRPF